MWWKYPYIVEAKVPMVHKIGPALRSYFEVPLVHEFNAENKGENGRNGHLEEQNSDEIQQKLWNGIRMWLELIHYGSFDLLILRTTRAVQLSIISKST